MSPRRLRAACWPLACNVLWASDARQNSGLSFFPFLPVLPTLQVGEGDTGFSDNWAGWPEGGARGLFLLCIKGLWPHSSLLLQSVSCAAHGGVKPGCRFRLMPSYMIGMVGDQRTNALAESRDMTQGY